MKKISACISISHVSVGVMVLSLQHFSVSVSAFHRQIQAIGKILSAEIT